MKQITTKFLDLIPDVPKSKFEISVVRYKEDLKWLLPVKNNVTAYNKGENLDYIETVKTRNFGVDVGTHLLHIITRYDSLSEITMFCQGSINDRKDQQLLPLSEYLNNKEPIKANLKVTYRGMRNYNCKNNLYFIKYPELLSEHENLNSFMKEFIGFQAPRFVHKWAQGSFLSVSKQTIHKKPKEYYEQIYYNTKLSTHIRSEDAYFLERSWYYIFS